MAIIVKKFGGSSLASIDRIKAIAVRIAQNKKENDQIIVVVSAMGDTTDNLLKMAHEIAKSPVRREVDMLLTAGERISMSLLSIALHEHNIKSISFTGSQSGIITDTNHGNARIIKVTAFRIYEELEKDKVVIIAGFQGVSLEKEVTTLGRGGSDTSALALACYLKADKCEILSDIDGVLTADPRIVANARMIEEIDYKQMLSFAYAGSQVLHPRSVEFAMKYNINVEIMSSFHNKKGTKLVKNLISEKREITAIANKKDLIYLKVEVESISEFYELLSQSSFEFFDSYIHDNKSVIIFIDDKQEKYFLRFLDEKNYHYKIYTGLLSISLIGTQLSHNLSIQHELISFFEKEKIQIWFMQIKETCLTFYFKDNNFVKLINALHDKYIN